MAAPTAAVTGFGTDHIVDLGPGAGTGGVSVSSDGKTVAAAVGLAVA